MRHWLSEQKWISVSVVVCIDILWVKVKLRSMFVSEKVELMITKLKCVLWMLLIRNVLSLKIRKYL